ncbi:hypothetical protein LC612_39290 [Nostoc sp. CHAB 5834]|nr:hypothetical protein [Nostoc sp. CHAB 5834]
MKIAYWYTLVCVLSFSGCQLKEREKTMNRRAKELDQKEQQLILREQQLNLKEKDLVSREKALKKPADSLGDSSNVYNPYLIGRWSVQMRCVETTCEGSAVGDTKTEQWNFSYKNNRVFAQAIVNNQLFRVYTGTYVQGGLVLTTSPDSAVANTRITVRLQFKSPSSLEGQREIFRGGDCRLVYALNLTKL